MYLRMEEVHATLVVVECQGSAIGLSPVMYGLGPFKKDLIILVVIGNPNQQNNKE